MCRYSIGLKGSVILKKIYLDHVTTSETIHFLGIVLLKGSNLVSEGKAEISHNQIINVDLLS